MAIFPILTLNYSTVSSICWLFCKSVSSHWARSWRLRSSMALFSVICLGMSYDEDGLLLGWLGLLEDLIGRPPWCAEDDWYWRSIALWTSSSMAPLTSKRSLSFSFLMEVSSAESRGRAVYKLSRWALRSFNRLYSVISMA